MSAGKLFVCALLGLGMLGSAAAAAAGQSTDGSTIANNTPRFVGSSRNLGAVNPATVMDVSIWLKPHDKAGLDAVAQQLYDVNSAKYRQWLTKAEFVDKYAPTAAEAAKVSQFLAANRLRVSKISPDNFYVRATGTAAAVSAAFHVSLNNYQVNGKVIRANAEDPFVSSQVAPLVAAVAGLDTLEYTHPLVTRATNRKAGTSLPGLASRPVSAATAAASLPFNPTCFPGQTKETFTTSGSLPEATYTGNEYTTDPAGCGYTPQNIWAAYKLNALYAAHLDGTGQTISIIDWCGSPTITQDANAFSKQFGLPALTSANFKIIYTPTPSYCASPDPEINIDVEWAHAIAPGANIDLVVPPSASFQDVDQGIFYAVDYQLGNNISGSFGSEELYTPTTVLQTEDLIVETAAILGISANFSTGDDGDFTFDFPQFSPASVSAPADSPYATGVGGISLALKADSTIAWQAGWGTNENLLAAQGYVTDPPANNGFFNFGSGGGESGFFRKPSYQSQLPGTGRQLPDVSWLADPFTGAYIAISTPFAIPELQYQVYGGTSLACPMFSALWAIANQEAGVPLGQAAPYMYKLPRTAILDIVPVASNTNVTGIVTDSSGSTRYSAASLAAPLEGTTRFISALWNYPLYDDTAFLLTFGTDSGLKTAPGWDNVTGVGVPNGKAFTDAVKPKP